MSSTARTPLACDAVVGQEVPPHDLLRQHVVEAITRLGDRPDSPRSIKTNQGEWEFRYDERVNFPRRPHGEITDWRLSDRAPLPQDLCVGDLLHPPTHPDERLPDPRLSPAWETATEETRQVALSDWEQDAQRVTAVAYDRRTKHLITVATHSRVHSARRWLFRADEQVIFPRPDAVRAPAPRAHSVEAHGPYRFGDEHVFFAVHPSGRGKWPGWLNSPIKIASKIFIARPPRDGEWGDFVGLTPWRRHPSDPKWGVAPAVECDLGETERLLQEYDKFQDRQRASARLG